MVRHGKVIWYSVFVVGDILTNLQVSVLIQMLPVNVNVDPNPRSAGAKLDVNDADLAKPIMFQTERLCRIIKYLHSTIKSLEEDVTKMKMN